MSIFIDSSKIEEIEKYHRMGIIRGVTTNPTIMLKDGISGGMPGIREHSIKIAKLVAPYPVSIEVFSNDKTTMLKQARELASWASNINVKITIHGPNGELDNLEVINQLENQHDIRVNATAIMSAQQCFLAALAGATYVSLFAGRVNNMGYNCVTELKKARELLDAHNLKAKVIAGSIREVLNVVEWLLAGAHIVTATPKIIEGMIIHPYSKETVQMFLNDAAKLTSSLNVTKQEDI